MIRGGLRGEMLLRRLFASNVVKRATRVMFVIVMRRSVSDVERRVTR